MSSHTTATENSSFPTQEELNRALCDIARDIARDLARIAKVEPSGKQAQIKADCSGSNRILSYTTFLGYAANADIGRSSAEKFVSQNGYGPLHDLCGDPDINIAFTTDITVTRVPTPVRGEASLTNGMYLSITVNRNQPYQEPATSTAPHNWPIETLIVGRKWQWANNVHYANTHYEGLAAEAITTKEIENQALRSAKAGQELYDFVRASLKAPSAHGLKGLLLGNDNNLASDLEEKITNLKIDPHWDTAWHFARHDFVAASRATFWMGRAWQQSKAVSAAKNDTSRRTAAARMQEYLEKAWKYSAHADKAIPVLLRTADCIPAAVMREIYARYDACWKAQTRDDQFGCYRPGVIGLNTNLQAQAQKARVDFNEAVRRQLDLVSPSAPRPAGPAAPERGPKA